MSKTEPTAEHADAWSKAAALFENETVRFVLLVIAGAIAWILMFDAYPVAPVISRYAEF